MNQTCPSKTARWPRAAAWAALLGLAMPAPATAQVGSSAPVRVEETAESVLVAVSGYRLRIAKAGLRYQIERPDGTPFAAAHPRSGLQLAAAGGELADVAATEVTGSTHDSIRLRAITAGGLAAVVSIQFEEHALRFAVRPEPPGSYDILLRTAGLSPGFGLADHAPGVLRRRSEGAADEAGQTTRIVDYTNDRLRSGQSPGIRMISNFVIHPRDGLALVNLEPGIKIVRVTAQESAQGSRGVRELPALHYFLGEPRTIYRGFLEARNRGGFPVQEPKYDFFGVGWEAWGALAWETNQQTVIENVEKYLELGYPLRWMVVGSGFWPQADENLRATTSFGRWDAALYPDPRGLIDRFHRRGLKFIIGLRIAFITGGPFSREGVERGYFIQEGGAPKVFTLGFPRKPAYLLDATVPGAVDWYLGLVKEWTDYGIDGFKEDLFGYTKYDLRDDKVDAINRALMDRGVMVMGRNAYLASVSDIHRYEDFNFNQNQDRGPLNGLALAYSGFPYVYPDVIGGTLASHSAAVGKSLVKFTDAQKGRYLMRYAQYAAVNPAMAVGYGPWNVPDEQVNRVVLAAARLHDRLHPYIYSAAIETHRTGFPYAMTPLPLAYPHDPNVYELENATRRSYQWLLGESLLAIPVYGDDYATAETRDVYLPEGLWIDYDTGERFEGPRTLRQFPIPVDKTPLFIGGKGIVVERREGALEARVFPVRTHVAMRFHHPDKGETAIALAVGSWNAPVQVQDADGNPVRHRTERGAIVFPLRSGVDYLVRSAR